MIITDFLIISNINVNANNILPPICCLGRRFADMEMLILLSKLVRNYKLDFKHPPLKYAITFMYAPDGDLKFTMTPREQ